MQCDVAPPELVPREESATKASQARLSKDREDVVTGALALETIFALPWQLVGVIITGLLVVTLLSVSGDL